MRTKEYTKWRRTDFPIHETSSVDEYESKYRDDTRHGVSGNGTRSARTKHDAVCVTPVPRLRALQKVMTGYTCTCGR